MEKIKIKITKLGAIKDSEVEITPVMIFSGESGLGKSYLAMLCHYVFDVLLDSTRIDRFVKEKGLIFSEMRKSFRGSGIATKINKSELERWLSKDALRYLCYMLNNNNLQGDISIELPNIIDDLIEFKYEEEITGIENNEEVYVKLSALGLVYRIKDESMDDESSFAFLLRYGLMNLIFGDFKALKETYVFPPSRGPVLTEEINPRTGMYEKFKNDLLKISRIQPHPEEADKDLIKLFKNVLEGTVYRSSDSYQYSFNGKEIPISAAAASIRELAPLYMLVERTDISKVVMIIEEPEAHLHPLKQRTMADITSVMCTGGAFMQITSHSDYYLRRINELISLKRLHKKCSKDDFEKICLDVNIDKRLEFDYERLSAYLLIKQENGESKVVRQTLKDGIPFSSFSKAIEDSLESRYKLNSYAEKYGCI